MTFIGAAIGEFPIGGIDDADSLAVTDPLTKIATADRPYLPSEISYVVIVYPYDFVAASTTTIRLSNDGGPSNVPYNSYWSGTEPFGWRVTRPYNFEARLPGVPIAKQENAAFLPGGSVTPAVGELRFDARDQSLDDWLTYDWTDRDVEVYVGAAYTGDTRPSWPTEYAQIFKGRTDRLGGTPTEFSLFVRDLRRRLEVPAQSNLYLGETTATGTDRIFTASTDIIASTSTDLSVFSDYTYIEVTGSASNNFLLKITSATTNAIQVDASVTGLVDESAGASVTIRGALEGTTELAGQPKPFGYGQIRQAQALLVDAGNLIYQLLDGSMESVGAVRDKGAALTLDSDYADITLAAPAGGEYATCLATGHMMLGASPDGQVTWDGEGDNSGTLAYQSSVSGILRKLFTERGGFTDPDELEVGSFDELEATTSVVIGWYSGTDVINVDAVADEIAADGGNIWWFPNRLGRIKVGRVPADPSTAAVDRYLPSAAAGSGQQVPKDQPGYGQIGREQASAPAFGVVLPYRRYWKTLDPGNVAASVSDADRQDFGQSYRFKSPTDSTVSDAIPSAGKVEFSTGLIDTAADAQTEASRLLSLFGTERSLFTLQVENPSFQYEPGLIVHVTLPTAALEGSKLGLDGGVRAVAVGVTENPAGSENPCTLILWA